MEEKRGGYLEVLHEGKHYDRTKESKYRGKTPPAIMTSNKTKKVKNNEKNNEKTKKIIMDLLKEYPATCKELEEFTKIPYQTIFYHLTTEHKKENLIIIGKQHNAHVYSVPEKPKITTFMELYQKALEKWGRTKQLVVAVEEMAELIIEICHDLRGNRGDNSDAISEEIADNEIMLEQLKHVIFNNSFQVMMKKKSKLNRLRKIVEEEAKS